MEFNMSAVSMVLGVCLIACIAGNMALFKKLAGLRKSQESSLKEISSTRESEDIYEKMIPGEMLKMLKVKRYSDLAVGDQQYFSSVIMDVNMADLSGMVQGKKVNEVFTSINRMLNEVIPVVYNHGGMVEGFQGGGLSALFLEEYERALTASVSICENINTIDGRDKEYESVTVGLCYGSVMIGVVGHERRMTILTLSEAEEFAGALRLLGHKYDAKIVVTSNFLNHIENSAKRFNYRLLGYIHIRKSGTLEKVYDVFDGDAVEIRNKKRKSKMVFEKGVELFAEQKFLEARQHFIEVLKMAPMDKAAKHYLLRCDEYFNSNGSGDIFIETC